jgi:hypothetical protein
MSVVRCVAGLFLLTIVAAPALSDDCSNLQAAIAKATELRTELQREASPFLSAATMPIRHDGVCAAAQKLRDHVAVVAKMIGEKCLNDDEYRSLTGKLEASMRHANDTIGLFCN